MQAVATFFVGAERRTPKNLNPAKILGQLPGVHATTHHEMAQTRRVGDAKTKDPQPTKAPRFFAVDGWAARTSRLPNAYPGRFMWHARLLPKISAQIPPGVRIRLPAYRNYGRLRLRHAECVQYKCTLHSHILSDDRSARFHPCVQRPYWCGVVTSDSDSLISVVLATHFAGSQ